MTLRLQLVKMDPEVVRGIYVIGGTHDRMPERALFLSPQAAIGYRKIQAWVVVSDMFRSADASLAAVVAKRGAMSPGYSMHNYGRAIDVDVSATMRGLPGVQKKIDLDVIMEQAGWFCHRTDHMVGKTREHPSDESWHYNFFGAGTKILPTSLKTTAGIAEARLVAEFGEDFTMDSKECQAALKKLGLYSGEIDGILGPLSRQAIAAFQRAWGLRDTGRLDERCIRTLVYVTCEKVLA